MEKNRQITSNNAQVSIIEGGKRNMEKMPKGMFRGGEQQDTKKMPKGTFRGGEQGSQTLPSGTFRGGEQQDTEKMPKGTFRGGEQGTQTLPPGTFRGGEQGTQTLPPGTFRGGEQGTKTLPPGTFRGGDQSGYKAGSTYKSVKNYNNSIPANGQGYKVSQTVRRDAPPRIVCSSKDKEVFVLPRGTFRGMTEN